MRGEALIRFPGGVDKKPATGLTDQSRRCGNQDKDSVTVGRKGLRQAPGGGERLHPRACAPARPRAPGSRPTAARRMAARQARFSFVQGEERHHDHACPASGPGAARSAAARVAEGRGRLPGGGRPRAPGLPGRAEKPDPQGGVPAGHPGPGALAGEHARARPVGRGPARVCWREDFACQEPRSSGKRAISRLAEVAQLVEQGTENPRVGSSILSLGTREISPLRWKS